MTDTRAFTDYEALYDYLERLNETGIVPEAAGYDSLDRPVIVWLSEWSGDEVIAESVVLGGPVAERPEIQEATFSELSYPLTIMLHPDDLLGGKS